MRSTSSSTARSFSLQNVSQSNRYKGNSMTIHPSIGSGVNLGGFKTSGSNNGGSQTALMMNMEEHAVMPEPSFSSTVSVYDALGLFPVSKELACKYK